MMMLQDKTITLLKSLPNCPRLSQFNLSLDEKHYLLVMPDDEANIKEYSFSIQEVMDNPDFFFNGALIHYKFRKLIEDCKHIFPNIKEKMITDPQLFFMSEDSIWDEPEKPSNMDVDYKFTIYNDDGTVSTIQTPSY